MNMYYFKKIFESKTRMNTWGGTCKKCSERNTEMGIKPDN